MVEEICLGPESTSHIEILWAFIKAKIKNTYFSIPNKYIIIFVREAEFKIKNKNNTEKLDEFLTIINL